MTTLAAKERTEQMLAMRWEGKTHREIAEVFGVTRPYVSQLIGLTDLPELHCRTCGTLLPGVRKACAIYCSDVCRRRGGSRSRICAECGDGCSGKVCLPCRRRLLAERANRKYDKLEALWSEGLKTAEIAAEFGATVPSIAQLVRQARLAGRDLPSRRAISPLDRTTRSKARGQLQKALEKGMIRRPERCEGCGDAGPVQAHHTDYQRPLYVHWLCEGCHHKAHGKESLDRTPLHDLVSSEGAAS